MWQTCRPYILRGAFAFLGSEQRSPTDTFATRWRRQVRKVVWEVFLGYRATGEYERKDYDALVDKIAMRSARVAAN